LNGRFRRGRLFLNRRRRNVVWLVEVPENWLLPCVDRMMNCRKTSYPSKAMCMAWTRVGVYFRTWHERRTLMMGNS
jgi:hypothetical protein